MTACVPDEGSEWAASVQRGAAIVALLLGMGAIAVVYAVGKRNYVPPTFEVTAQAYYLVVFGEALVSWFLVAYLLHLTPCFFQDCMLASDASLSAYILVLSWPLGIIGTMVGRYRGSTALTLFRKGGVEAEEAGETSSIGAFFQFRQV